MTNDPKKKCAIFNDKQHIFILVFACYNIVISQLHFPSASSHWRTHRGISDAAEDKTGLSFKTHENKDGARIK